MKNPVLAGCEGCQMWVRRSGCEVRVHDKTRLLTHLRCGRPCIGLLSSQIVFKESVPDFDSLDPDTLLGQTTPGVPFSIEPPSIDDIHPRWVIVR